MEELETLATLWHSAKREEEYARARRVDIEQQILRLHPAKEEGAQTVHTQRGTKITITGKVTYKVDLERLTQLTETWPDDIKPIKTREEADEAKLKAIRSMRPELWQHIAIAVETKPAKTGFEIKFKEMA